MIDPPWMLSRTTRPQIRVLAPVVFSFGVVAARSEALAEYVAERLHVLGGDKRLAAYHHGRASAFVLRELQVDYLRHVLDPMPLSTFLTMYAQGPRMRVQAAQRVRMVVSNTSARAYRLTVALLPLGVD